MRYLMFLVMGLAVLWSAHSMALPVHKMNFRIQPYGFDAYECSSVWNPLTQEALIRVGLILYSADDIFTEKTVSFATAKSVDFSSRRFPEVTDRCSLVSQWNLEYGPGLPNYLMYLALKGPGCEKVARSFDKLQPQLHFKGISLSPQQAIDVIVDIDR